MGGARVDREARRRRVLELVTRGYSRVKEIAAAVRSEWSGRPGVPLTIGAASGEVYKLLKDLNTEGLVTTGGSRSVWRVPGAVPAEAPGPAGATGVPYSPGDHWSLEELLLWVTQVEGLLPDAADTAPGAADAVRAAIEERDRLRKQAAGRATGGSS